MIFSDLRNNIVKFEAEKSKNQLVKKETPQIIQQ
jgi:hypothetical protein